MEGNVKLGEEVALLVGLVDDLLLGFPDNSVGRMEG